jgi:hypothetical protein
VASGARASLVCAAALAIALAGCGGSEAPEPEPRPVEPADPLPDLPSGWRVHANPAGGYAFGLPRGWRARDRGTTTEVRSFDRLAAIAFTADRTGEALALDPAEFATRTAAATAGFEEPLDPGEPSAFEHRYEAAEVEATGTNARTGVEQDVSVIALRRDRLAVLTATIFANATPGARRADAIADRVVGTLRSRPVVGAAG